MKRFLTALLLGSLIFVSPAVVSAAETTYESEEGQAMIKPPSSEQASESTDETSEPQEEGTISSSGSSDGMDWSAANTENSTASTQGNFTVCVDAGHQGSWVDMSAQEPMAPGSSQTKNKATTGTSGNFSNVPEYEVNLEVSLVLQKELISRGYNVVMTREDNDAAISNKERAELATEKGADITVRIHANGADSSSSAGALTMAPTSSNQYLSQDIIEKSNTLASCIINHYCDATGLGNLGVISSDNMTGTNWSTVPVAILEMGFMSNQNDDLYITNAANHETMAKAVADGIDEYFSIVAPDTVAIGKHLSALTDKIEKDYVDVQEKQGESWAVSVMDLSTQAYSTVNAEVAMKSASVIKAFIMAAVYDKMVYPDGADTASAEYESTLKPLLAKMITVSDNDAANELVRQLGNGDFAAGAAVVNEFCQEREYTSTHLGREFLAKEPTDDNYVSASDIYNGTLVNEKADSDMLELLKGQTVKTKIPVGVPDGVETANKTGELSDAKLGVVENDIAIVFDATHPYVIAVLSNGVKSNSEAQNTIAKISKDVYEFMASQK